MRTKRIVKFGGSSLSDAKCFLKVVEIIKNKIKQNPIVVVSALGCNNDCKIKVTDSFKKAGIAFFKGDNANDIINKIIERHFDLLDQLNLNHESIYGEIEKLKSVIELISSGAFESQEEALDAIMGFGERFSSTIMTNLLCREGLNYKKAEPLEFCFISNDAFQNADILESSLQKIATKVLADPNLLVFPGYVAVTENGKPTTLGRGGSDYTGAVLGAALKRDVEIWTDVDGIYKIAPKFLPENFKSIGHPETIPHLSYDEAFQMAAFGSKVLHQKTISAVWHAIRKGKHIHLIIKNTFNPDHPGTVISSIKQHAGKPRGITCLEGTQLFNLYPDSAKEVEEFKKELGSIQGVNIEVMSETWGRLSFVLDKYHPKLSELESKYRSHLSKNQVLIKIVGDGIGENPKALSKIHSALQSGENLEKYGMTLVHKSPQILTENTFEFIVKKRGLSQILLQLYKDLFMENIVNIGLLGMGTVGGGVIRYARDMYSTEKSGFKLNFPSVLVRNPDKVRDIEYSGNITTDADDILTDPLIDIVLEVIGGLEPAKDYILKALKYGKNVVTANKALMAEHGAQIFKTAAKYGRNIGFEASVCAEIPIIDDFLTFPGLADVEGIEGIVNGTSNFVLSRFMEGMSYEKAVKIAQEKGFAEADPYMDVSGTDAAQKLSILASILFNQPIDYKKIPRQGIEGLKESDGYAFSNWKFSIKPLVLAKIIDGCLHLRVSPALISLNHPLSSVRDENNALSLYLEGREEPITKIGKGAGAIPTARSIVRDVLDVSRKSRSYMVELPTYYNAKNVREVASDGEFESSWYVRFTVTDSPGVFGKIASILGDFDLSIKRVLQEKTDNEKIAHILFELKKTPKTNLDRAADVITRFPFMRDYFSCMILD